MHKLLHQSPEIGYASTQLIFKEVVMHVFILLFFCAIFLTPLATMAQEPLTSWVDSANSPESDYPIQNLPYGVFSRLEFPEERRIGVAIGNCVLDIKGCLEEGLLNLPQNITQALNAETLNAFMTLGPDGWHQARLAIQQILLHDSVVRPRGNLLIPLGRVSMHLPASIGDYSDFYTSLDHAMNVGKLFRPDAPLPLNFKYLPLGYHGRASSIVVSGTNVRRPHGQVKDGAEPVYIPCQKLDYEMELATFIGPGNSLGRPISIDDADGHLFGMVVLNDWSARDIQKWEYVPLGPFNSKNFCSSISPWVVTLEALEPYRIPGPPRQNDDPIQLPYLQASKDFSYDIVAEVYLTSQRDRDQGLKPTLISSSNFSTQYWTFAQMLAQHTSTGSNMRPGDLIGSGTISGPTRSSRGCLLEFSLPDGAPVTLSDGTQRHFLLDGDEVILKAYAKKDGLPRIGFGECRGVVLPAN